MRIHVCVFLLCASSFASPQNPFMPAERPAELPVQLKTQLLSIRDAALQDDYAYNQLAHLTDNIGPRPGGSLQAQSAVEYVAEQMRKLGLDVHLEEAMVRQWQRGTDLAELVAWPEQTPGTTQKIVVTALGGNTPTPPAGITADVIVVNNFTELQTLGRKNVSGKIVLFNFPYDKQKAANGHGGQGSSRNGSSGGCSAFRGQCRLSNSAHGLQCSRRHSRRCRHCRRCHAHRPACIARCSETSFNSHFHRG